MKLKNRIESMLDNTHAAMLCAAYGTAAVAVLVVTMATPRFQTRFVGWLSAWALLAPFTMPTVDVPAALCALLAFSSMMSVMAHSHGFHHWVVFMALLVADLLWYHAYWSLLVALGTVYIAQQFPWCWRVWSLGGVLVYVWPDLVTGWVPLGYALLMLSERYVCRSALTNKKII